MCASLNGKSKIAISNELMKKDFFDDLQLGIGCVDIISGTITYANRKAKEFFPHGLEKETIDDVFGEWSGKEITGGEVANFVVTNGERSIEVHSQTIGKQAVLIFHDVTKMAHFEEESNTLKSLTKQLKNVYEQYNDDTICITDEKGIVEFAGEACYRHCGITAEDIIGMDMATLEREKFFYPSVTLRVLESQKNEVVMSNTNIGVVLITIGVPLFDSHGKLKKVISISRDFSKEVEIASLMAATKQDLWNRNDTEEYSSDIVTCSESMFKILTLMRMVSKTDSTVFITGETGTGKTLFAKYIHNNSNRATKPFIVVNCGAISENLIESELFGYEAGSFTGANRMGKPGLLELANGGTLFLDEVSELPLAQQVKLLHVLQEKTMMRVGGREYIDLDFRVVAATNKNLEKMVEEGTFREDLYYRLDVVRFEVPCLRDRKEDIPLLINHFMRRMNESCGMNKEISKEAIRLMGEYRWPGNVRELENVMEMLNVVTMSNTIDSRNLPQKIRSSTMDCVNTEGCVDVRKITLMKNAIQETEEKLLRLAMDECKGNQFKMAEMLGVDRSTVTRKINQYGLHK